MIALSFACHIVFFDHSCWEDLYRIVEVAAVVGFFSFADYRFFSCLADCL